jgi:hypothetical protein
MFRQFLAEKEREKREAKRQKLNPFKKTTTQNQHNMFIGIPNLNYQYSTAIHQNAWKNDDSRKLFNHERGENDLFQPAELAAITREVFEKSSKCRNKHDQLTLIFEITAKYIYNAK